ncbi:DUF4442 domain-containing protein [Nocardia sp. NPDC006630]|uniref:DUF4442 domain-containing protein n=1 Tax=Nocardia sp. NPDC006630 TaxID=3157181 RepID=UPI0033B0E9D3
MSTPPDFTSATGRSTPPRSARAMVVGPRLFPALMNCYPPFLCAGVRVRRVAPDWTAIRVTHRVRPWNWNVNRSAFGGTLFAMTDPFYAVMAARQLGPGYRIWNTTGSIDFLAPGRDTVTATMELDPAQIESIRSATARGEKSITTHTTEILSADGTLVARASQSLYVRRAHP